MPCNADMISIMSEMIAKLFKDGRSSEFEKHAAVLHAGDDVASMYLIIEGQIDLVRHSQNGTRTILHRARAGEVLAEASAYSGVYHCDGIAVAPSRLNAIPVAVFRKRLDDDPGLSNAWAGDLAHALQNARMNSEIRALRTVSERLDAWLAGGRMLPPKGEWQDLAQILGVTREALYRELAQRHR